MSLTDLIPWQYKLAGAGILLAAGIGSGIWFKGVLNENKTLKTQLAIQLEYVERAEKMQKEMNEVSNEYQKKITSADARANAALVSLRKYKSSCPENPSPSGHNATPDDTRLYWTDDEAARVAIGLATVATKQTEQLVACQRALRVCN